MGDEFMKGLLFITVLLFICCNYDNKTKTNVEVSDYITITNGIKENLEHGIETFYYAKKRGDIINLCIDLFEYPEWNKMIITFQNHWKTVASSDTSIVSEIVSDEGYKRTTYKEQMLLMELFFKKLAQEKDIKNLTNLEYPLLSSGELNVEISQILLKSKNKDITDAIRESSLYEKINNLLNSYSLEIDNVFVDKYAYVNKESFQDENLIDSIPSLLDIHEFIDCHVDFSIKRQKYNPME